MKKLVSGFAWHCHHDILYEWVTDYAEREKYIRKHKLAAERELRLRLFRMIPLGKVPVSLDKARAAYDQARDAYYKAWVASNKQVSDTYYKAGAASWQARAAIERAGAASGEDMLALHKELCPSCPWDGKTIFPGAATEVK